MKNLNRKEIGKLGEDIAVRYLEKNKYKILEKNYLPSFIKDFKKGKTEIDIIAKKKDTICFIEVKSISSQSQDFQPEDKVNFLKQKKLIKTAQFYFLEKRVSLNRKWQIDIISLKIDFNSKKAKLRHFKNAVEDKG